MADERPHIMELRAKFDQIKKTFIEQSNENLGGVEVVDGFRKPELE